MGTLKSFRLIIEIIQEFHKYIIYTIFSPPAMFFVQERGATFPRTLHSFLVFGATKIKSQCRQFSEVSKKYLILEKSFWPMKATTTPLLCHPQPPMMQPPGPPPNSAATATTPHITKLAPTTISWVVAKNKKTIYFSPINNYCKSKCSLSFATQL